MQSRPNPNSKFRLTLLAALTAVTFSACGDDNDDNNDNQVNTPAEVPTPTPTPEPMAFKWASVRADQREDTVLPPPPTYCDEFVRFEIRSNRDFRNVNPCDASLNKSGKISENDFGAIDALMNGISFSEASSKLKCTEFNDNNLRADHRLSMTSTSKRLFSLYNQDDDRECVSGNPEEITAIREKLYELRSKYTLPE